MATISLNLPCALASRPGSEDALRVLTRELGRGSTSALGSLYDQFEDRWFGLALWITRDRDEAADVVQDAVVKIWDQRARVARAFRPEAYLLRIVRFTAIDRVRRRKATVPVDDIVLPVSSRSEARAEAKRISQHLQRLPEPQRSVLYMRFFLDLTFREIGMATGTTTFTAASRYRLGLRKLRRWMGT